MRVVILIGALCGFVAAVGGIAFFSGERYALDRLTVYEATPGQLAAAMQNDEFYADYNEDTLVVRGQIASLTEDGVGAVMQFQTPGAFTTRCQLEHYPMTVHPGDTISVLAQGATAERLASAVLLRGCSLIGDRVCRGRRDRIAGRRPDVSSLDARMELPNPQGRTAWRPRGRDRAPRTSQGARGGREPEARRAANAIYTAG